MAQLPAGHAEIDWDSWAPPGEGDVRSPCPALNALANHGILPHDGKNITKAMAVKALSNPSTMHLTPFTASLLAIGGVAANPDHHEHSFDLDQLDKHNFIEHDGSLSRNDFAFGNNFAFNHELWKESLDRYTEGGKTNVTYENASRTRYARVQESKDAHAKADKMFEYGIKQAILSYGESSFLLNVLGTDGVIPLEFLRILIEEERLPYKEGWRPPKDPVDQIRIQTAILKLIAANEHRAQEAVEVGMGTVQAMEMAIKSLLKMPGMCSVM